MGIERFAVRKRAAVPSAAPEMVPMAVASVPHLYPIGQQTEFGFLYAQLSTAATTADDAVIRAGDTMTGRLRINPSSGNILELQDDSVTVTTFNTNGALDVNPANDIGVLIQARHGGVTDWFVSSSGNMHARGNVGIGPFADAPTNRLEVNELAVRTFFTQSASPGSGLMGWRIDKLDKTSISATGLTFLVNGVPCWDLGHDFDTNNSDRGGTGNADLILAYDYTAGWTDDGVHTFALGADMLRLTPAEKSFTGKSCSWHWSGQAAGRNPTIYWGIMEAGIGQSGVNLSINGSNVNQHLLMTQRSAVNNSCTINMNQQWLVGQDVGATSINTGDISFLHVSQNVAGTPTAVNKTRFFIQGTTNARANVGINTNNPIGLLHVPADLGTALATNIATLFTGGYSLDLQNRSINLQQISNNVDVTNALLLHGAFAGTGAAPTFTSSGAFSGGLLCNDISLSLAVAAGGVAQTILRPVSISGTGGLTLGFSGGTLGFFAATPQLKTDVSGSRGSNAALTSLLDALTNYGLIINSTSA